MINVVCAVILDDRGRLLACQRPAGKSLAHKWEFPGGKIERGEDAREALKREVIEELGCSLKIIERLTAVKYDYPDFSIRLIPFLSVILSGKPEAFEHSELRWVLLSECDQLDWAEADVPIWKLLMTKDAGL